ncbi:hypothetical protein B0H11DRAFT_2006628 [Mycena galericulata]|nr:hypothetical protein B0H11DRAFT_2006628 [Mycena galericulata]
MHPALDLDRLRLLPPSYRKYASAAANGSFDDLMTLVGIAKDKPASTSRLLLPAFYANLDPAKTHLLEHQEILSSVEAKCVIMAFVAVQGLSVIKDMPPESYPDLWPGLWSWSQLIMKHDYCLPTFEGYRPSEVHITILQVFRILHSDRETAKIINEAPGIRVLVARVWALLARPDEWAPGIRTSGFETICHFLRWGMDVSNMRHHEDLIEGSGGTMADLASLVVKFVTYLASDHRKKSIFFLDNALAFIDQTELLRKEFLVALLSHGIVRALVTVIRQLSTADGPMADQALDPAFRMLTIKMLTPPGHVWLIEALDAGFLALFATCLLNPKLISEARWKESITANLSRHLIYRSVLLQVGVSLAGVTLLLDNSASRGSPNSPLWKAWDEINKVLLGQLPLLKYYDSPEYTAMRACDNTECGKISSKADFRSCSVCQNACYCSVECQRLDWRRGHRKLCAKIRSHGLMNPDPTNARDRSFLRALLHKEYETRIHDVLLCELAFMAQHPGAPFHTAFDYVEGRGTFGITCGAATNSAAARALLGPLWEDVLSRANASGGRMRLHLLGVGEGSRRRWRVIPLRTRGATQWRGLVRLAQEIPRGTTDAQLRHFPQVSARLHALIRETRTPGAEIH